jgi:hypothetical protein
MPFISTISFNQKVFCKESKDVGDHQRFGIDKTDVGESIFLADNFERKGDLMSEYSLFSKYEILQNQQLKASSWQLKIIGSALREKYFSAVL